MFSQTTYSYLMHAWATIFCIVSLVGCDRVPDTAQIASPPAKEVTPAKAWTPIPFDQANFLTNDTSLFFAEFARAVQKAAKGSYESTAEYKKRMLDIDAAIPPFSSKSSYALLDMYAELVYNADTKAYERRFAQGGCYPLGDKLDDMTCHLHSVTDSKEKYVGKNAFGATAEITKESGRDLALIVKKANLSGPRFRTEQPNFRLLNVACPVPLQRAKDLNGQKILVALVVSIREPRVISNGHRNESATVSSPYEKSFENVGIPVLLKKTVCFVEKTREILHAADVK